MVGSDTPPSAKPQTKQPDMFHEQGMVDIDNDKVEVLKARLKKIRALISLKHSIERVEDSKDYNTLLSKNPLFEEANSAKGIELRTEETALKTKIESLSIIEKVA